MTENDPGPAPALSRAIRYFTQESRSLSCMSIVCGDGGAACCAMGGAALPDGTPVAEDSLFDLASLSKLFTALSALRLRAEGKLDFGAPVTRYAPQFFHLDGVSVEQVLGFEIALRTPERIDAQKGPLSAARTLFSCSPFPNGAKAYSDIHAMTARYILEGAADMPLMEIVERELLRPLGMKDTYCRVPEELRARCVSHDREHRIEGERAILREGVAPGTAHDPKARAMAPDGEAFCGHAGLFSTAGDIEKLCRGVLRGDVIGAKDMADMARNRTGLRLPSGEWTQYLGLLCYVKHPLQRRSEVPAYMGGRAISLSGFVGNHIAIDPERGIFEFFLGSRVQDRLTVLIPPRGRTLADYGLAPDGTGAVDWPGEGKVISSVDFVYLKDDHYHPAVAEAMGL